MEPELLDDLETPPFLWRPALVWAGAGLAITVAAMRYTGMPAGGPTELAVLFSAVALAFSIGGAVSGYRNSRDQSLRNVLALGTGSVIGVAVMVAVDVAESTSPLLGYLLMGTIYLGVPAGAVGVLSGLFGHKLGLLLARNKSQA